MLRSALLRSLITGGVALVASTSVTAASTPVSSTVTLPAGWPQRLVISRIHVSAPIESLDLSRPAFVHAPEKWGDVAWYTRSAKPGDIGHASIYGHLDSTCCPAIFYRLKDLKVGDSISVLYRKGKPLQFKVMWSAVYDNRKLPVKFMFGPARDRGLQLITCSGAFHRDGTGYDHKLVVYARLVLPNGKLG